MNKFIHWLWIRQIRRLPHFRSPKLLELPRKKRVLLFAPHSDDEWIGCGGTLSLLKSNQCEICVVILTDGAQGDPQHFFSEDIAEKRREETRKTMGSVGIEDFRFLDFPDGGLAEHINELSESVAKIYDGFAPDWVLTTSFTEHHRDHVCAAHVVASHWLSRGRRERLLAYEIYGAIRADWLVDITPMIALKRALIAGYEVPLRYIDYEAASISMARLRGVLAGDPLSECYAEAFMEIKRADVVFELVKRLFDGGRSGGNY